MQQEIIKPDAAKIPQKPANTFEPPHSVQLHFKKREIAIRVTLHKIPEKYVNIVPRTDKFHVDAIGWTKKAWLDVTFPQGAKVDVDRGQAVLDAGILSVTLPITECIDKETGQKVKFNKYGDIVVEKSTASSKPAKSTTSAAADKKNSKNKTEEKKESPKRKQQKKETSPFEDQMDVSDDESGESGDVADSEVSLDDSAPAASPAADKKSAMKKKKIPVAAMTTEQLEEKRQRQKKKAPAAMDFTLKTIEELAAVEDKKRDDYLKKESQKMKHFEEKEVLKTERKEAKKERAKIAAQKALAERKKKLKAEKEARKAMEQEPDHDDAPAPKPEKKRKAVSFSEVAPTSKKTKTK